MAQAKVNIPARLAYAETLRHLASGLITVDEHEASYFRISRFYGSDVLVDAIWDAASNTAGVFYSGRLKGRYAMSRVTRRHVAQCVLLLRSSRITEPAVMSEATSTNDASLAIGLLSLSSWLLLVIAPVILMCAGFVGTGFLVAIAWIMLGFGIAIANEICWDRERRQHIDPPFDVLQHWPFSNRNALTAARQRPTYLCGVRSVSLA
ncbi:MAG TPA: hypothetical protein VF777_07725 [Phycisphaerales bacterium]